VRLSLKWKIAGGFGAFLLLIVLLGWVTLSLLLSLRSVQRRVLNEALPGLVAVNEVVRSYTAQAGAVRGSLIGSQQALLERYQFEVATAEFWEQQAQELFTSGEERERLDQLIEAGRQFHELVDERIVPLALEGNRTSAFRILDQEGTRLISDIEIQGELLRTAQEQSVAQTEDLVASRSRAALIIVSLVVGGALLLGAALAYLLPRRLARNMDRLVEATRAIERGEFAPDLDIRSGDEVEELAERFKGMGAGLKRLQQLALQDRELEIAASIQTNLLRRSIPETPGLRVVAVQRHANLVGGDWYDVDVGRDEVTVVVGDPSGKGIAAALMATVALSFLRAETALGSSGKKVVERTNEALLEATDSDSFTTLIYARFDITARAVTWLNMGHPAPFLLRAAPGEGTPPQGYYLEGPRNRALGWFDDPGLADTVAHLHPGDRLFFFTDGFLEAKAPDGEVFGEHRFADALLRLAPVGMDEIGDRLIGEVERFAAGKLDDDLTMLVVEFEGAPAGAGEGLAAATGDGRQTGEEPWHSRR
jgi:CHASE3 domain sensor protein